MTAILSGLIGVMVGALLSAVVAFRLAAHQERRRLTLALYDEFHSQPMLVARIDAWKELMTGTPADGSIRWASLQRRTDAGALGVSVVLHFFDKLRILLHEGLVDQELLAKLLGRHVQTWGNRYFAPERLSFDGEGDSSPLAASIQYVVTHLPAPT